MVKTVFLVLLFMVILSACQTTQGTNEDFNQIYKDSPVDLSGR